jgi:sensor domain CHASE-containing protein
VITPGIVLGAIEETLQKKEKSTMFIINPEGKLVYNGAIDDKPSTDTADIAAARNYVATALDEAMAGKPVTTASSPPYGCSVKY